MVFSGDGAGEEVRDLVMAIRQERSKPPLHNFNLPCLKWGNQRHLRCMKLSDSKDNNIISADRIRSPPTRSVAARDYEVRRFKKLKPINHDEEGIEAVREKIMCDLKAAADKLKASIFRKGLSDENRRRRREEEEAVVVKKEKSQSAATDEEARPWNLRTRRAACKAPVGGNPVNGRIEERGVSNCSPVRSESSKSREKNKEEETEPAPARPKLAVALSRKEIDDDFLTMLGHRPSRRPKKRPRNVQKQLDMLFPGLWLPEVSVDTYKVPELPDNNAKR